MAVSPPIQKDPFKGKIMSVTGLIDPALLDVTDAHNHIWIEPVAGSAANSPVLMARSSILGELVEYRQAGGSAVVDCQPGGCGRNGLALLELSRESGVAVIACSGFHRRVYYAPTWWLWEVNAQQAARYFIDEIQFGLQETRNLPQPVRAGLIKCACEATVKDTPQAALEGAALAALETGVCVQIHTEKGADAEAIFDFFTRRGVHPGKVVLCHMDKAPDFGLHRALAKAGAMLEYDTFYRPKYNPERYLWPLIEQMVSAGFDQNIVLGTDMAEAAMWRSLGGGPGMMGMLTILRPRLETMGLNSQSIQRLLGGNIACRLAGMV